ncbi:MAG: putative DNA binding domain-containing protein [Desulfuromusa sp.]|nr:putative DNA binding domain-containing protein [Desulfuromusa sp.]
MTEAELHSRLTELLAQPAETEWLEFKAAKSNVDFKKLGQYFSALSNEANLKGKTAGWLVFGVNDKHEVVGTQYRAKRASLDKLKNEIANKTTHRLTFVEIHELVHTKGRVLLFEIPPAPRGIPIAWEGHYYGRDGESLGPLNLVELEQIRGQALPDWSVQVCEGATLKDLDTEAINKARENYKEKHPKQVQEVDSWSDAVFLNKAKVAISGKITRAALLLLGREEAAHFLSPAQGIMTWVLKDEQGVEKDYRHFGPPFLLNTEALFAQVRNLTYRYLRDGTLFPTEVSQYDPWVIRELLHNCIAHQDYTLNGRITIVDRENSLLFSNRGSFIPCTVEQVITQDSPPDLYRNPFLAQAMVELNMIDTIGSGIRRVFATQRNRFFPLPDYDLHEPQRVQVTLYGHVLDENYTRMLINNTDLELYEVMALDKVQKREPLTDDENKLLRKKKLIEGRRPNLYVAAKVARLAGSKSAYIRNRTFDSAHYKKMVIEYLKKFHQASSPEVSELLFDKMPEVLSEEQKKNKIRNLLQQMARDDKSIKNMGGRGKSARWVLAD